MNPKELYEKQYGEKKPMNKSSFFFLRKIFNKYDLSREDIAVLLLDKKGAGEKFLDIGCGDGSLIFKVNNKFKQLYGIDIASNRIEKAQETVKRKFSAHNIDKKFYFSVQDINKKIIFPDNTFNVITCLAVLEHLFDPFFAIKEINRILKPGGIFILKVPNIAYIKYRIQLLFGIQPKISAFSDWQSCGWDGGVLHYFTKRTLLELLEKNNFKVLEITGSGLFSHLRSWRPSLLTGDLVVKAKKIK